MSTFLKGIVGEMQPKARIGRPPVVTPCPYCGVGLSQTDHRNHRSACKADFRNAPPQNPEDAPAQSAELDQTPGGGYNRNRSFPQT